MVDNQDDEETTRLDSIDVLGSSESLAYAVDQSNNGVATDQNIPIGVAVLHATSREKIKAMDDD